MAINRVDLADETLIDISDSTVSADTLASGEIAYGADGEQIVGIAEFGGDTTDCYKTTDTASTSIADTDYIPLSDANGNKKKSLWSNIKTVLGKVFALKNHTVINGSLSMGRKDGTTVGNVSVALGYNCVASGWASHAEGYYSTASGDNACHAEGYNTTASGNTSHSEGYNTKASSNYQHVQGKYNVEDTENKYAHIVGNGTSDSNRKNAHTLDWNGNAWFAGDVESATAGKLSKKTTHHFGYIQSGYASTQYKVASLSSGDIVPEDDSYTETTFNVHDGDLITLQSESNNTYSATADSPIYITIDEVNYKVVYYNNAVATGTNTAYYGAGNRNITYRIDTIRRLAHFFSKDWDNNTTYNFKTAYNSSTNKAVTESDLNAITSGVGDTPITRSPAQTAVATGTYTEMTNMTLTKGVWYIGARAQWAKSSAKDLRAVISGTTASGSALANATLYDRPTSNPDQSTDSSFGGVVVITDTSDVIYFNMYHNAGANLDCRVWMIATKIANL